MQKLNVGQEHNGKKIKTVITYKHNPNGFSYQLVESEDGRYSFMTEGTMPQHIQEQYHHFKELQDEKLGIPKFFRRRIDRLLYASLGTLFSSTPETDLSKIFTKIDKLIASLKENYYCDYSTDFVIFIDKNDELTLLTKKLLNGREKYINIFHEYKHYTNQIPLYFHQEFNRKLGILFGRLFKKEKYESSDEKKIKEIVDNSIYSYSQNKYLGSSRDHVVYLDKHGNLDYEFDRKKYNEVKHVGLNKFSELKNIVLSNEKIFSFKKDEINQCLGAALVKLLETTVQENEQEKYFKNVERLIHTSRIEMLMLTSILWSSLFTILITLMVSKIVNDDITAMSMMGGSIGAYLSVLIKRNEVSVLDYYVSLNFVRIESVIRILLGFLFGWFALILSKSNFAFGFINNLESKSIVPTMFIIAIIAGFSERLIPHILEKVADENINEKKNEN